MTARREAGSADAAASEEEDAAPSRPVVLAPLRDRLSAPSAAEPWRCRAGGEPPLAITKEAAREGEAGAGADSLATPPPPPLCRLAVVPTEALEKDCTRCTLRRQGPVGAEGSLSTLGSAPPDSGDGGARDGAAVPASPPLSDGVDTADTDPAPAAAARMALGVAGGAASAPDDVAVSVKAETVRGAMGRTLVEADEEGPPGASPRGVFLGLPRATLPLLSSAAAAALSFASRTVLTTEEGVAAPSSVNRPGSQPHTSTRTLLAL